MQIKQLNDYNNKIIVVAFVLRVTLLYLVSSIKKINKLVPMHEVKEQTSLFS